MHASRALRPAVTAAAAVAIALSLAPTGAFAAGAPAGDPDVRLVVRTATRGDGPDVAAAAARQGARPAGRVPRLKAVALDVAAGDAAAVSRFLLGRGDVTSVDVAHQRWLSEEPADPRFADQRSYLDAVKATTAWGRPAHGSPAVRIGIVDSGVDVSHPDLAGKISGTFNAVDRTADVRDVVGHGTGVASVAAAATGNGTGISGAGYDSTILAAKVADRSGRIFTDDLAAGIVWAVDNGAEVINLSLGGPSSDRLERDAISYAQDRDVLVVAAAGNDATSTKQYPAALPDVLSVGATSTNGSTRAPFSTFGSWVDVAAPGRGILVAAPGGSFEKADGTSFSTPLVSGQVALLAAFRPGRTAGELAAAVVGGANTARLGFAHGLVDFDASLDLLPPASVPAVTAPAPGAPVSGVTTVSASSSAPRVRLTLADLSVLVTTAGGVASTSFETYGLTGAQQVTATDCSRIDQCNPSGVAAVTVTVDNPAPVLTGPADGSGASGDTVPTTADAPGGAVRFLLDGATVTTDSSAPFSARVSTAGLADGPHTVSAVQCRADGAVCDLGRAGTTSVVVNRLHPRIVSLSTRLLSPQRDGRNDRATVAYRLESRQAVALRVRNAAGALVRTRSLGEQPAGRHSADWDGRGAKGAAVPSGPYTVEISTRAPGGALTGLTAAAVLVDRSAPRATGVSRPPGALFPVRDRYRDTTRVRATLPEPVRWLELQVRSRAGSLVRTERVQRRPAGPSYIGWNGRTDSGRVAPSGTYTARLVAQDPAGNRATSAPVRVAVSGQRLVRRSGSITVTARESIEDTFADDCSQVFRHTDGPRKGWIGYFSSGTCTAGDAYAIGDHQVRLPEAVRYGRIRVSARGGRSDGRFPDSARIAYYDKLQNLSDNEFRLRPGLGTYTGPSVAAERHLIRHRVFRWSTFATGVNWYDVERYTVRYTYFVLR